MPGYFCKGSEIITVKELQPSVFTSCCREDRHVNNQIDIKSEEYNRVFMMAYILQGDA